MHVFTNATHRRFKLFQLLQTYGKPDTVNIQVYKQMFDGYPPFYMSFIYEKQGIIALFETKTLKVGDMLKGCFKSGDSARI